MGAERLKIRVILDFCDGVESVDNNFYLDTALSGIVERGQQAQPAVAALKS